MDRKRKIEKLDPHLAHDICDDLPDGAYWAMMEELTGMEPAELIDVLETEEK